MSTVDLLDQVLDPFVDCLTLESAAKIASLRAEPAVQSRLNELADRANEGTLSGQDRADYESLLAVFHMISLLQSKARQFLNSGQRP
jgi:hypothetical protein